MDKLWHCRLIRKVKNLNIYVSFLFFKLEPVSGSRGAYGGACLGGHRDTAPSTTRLTGAYECICEGGGGTLCPPLQHCAPLKNLFFEKILIPFLTSKLFDHIHTSTQQVLINYLRNFLNWTHHTLTLNTVVKAPMGET